MGRPSSSEVSRLLQAWNDGDETALEKLMPLVYKELHRMARFYMARESPGHTLQTTALVNEAYVRLLDSADLDEALKALAKVDPRKSQVVELRFFGGLNLEETAQVLKVSSDTVMRDWKMAKNWLRCELSGERLDGA